MIRTWAAVTAVAFALSGCGQKGSLYFAEPAMQSGAPVQDTERKDDDKDSPAPQDP